MPLKKRQPLNKRLSFFISAVIIDYAAKTFGLALRGKADS